MASIFDVMDYKPPLRRLRRKEASSGAFPLLTGRKPTICAWRRPTRYRTEYRDAESFPEMRNNLRQNVKWREAGV